MTSKNFKRCGLYDPPIKIQDWKKQCFSCSHGEIVALRSIQTKGFPVYYEKAYLLGCPHMIWDRNFCVPTKFEIAQMGKLLDLEWNRFKKVPIDVSFRGCKKVEYAFIPRENWVEILQIPQVSVKPCPKCDGPDVVD